MPYLETIKLSFDNNLILGHCPDKLGVKRVNEKTSNHPAKKSTIESFGLFDANQANYNTYYPDVTAKDLAPKDNEFIQPVFRALSEVIVHKNWNPVDFSMNGVLRKSRTLLVGQTVNVDHETAVGNAIGAVLKATWQDSYKTPGGIIVPAGINSVLKIDGKSHPRLARAIMMDPPAIHSTSVTVQFMWEKSHASMTEEEFFKSLGSFDKDGQLVRRIATEVRKYNEISLVSHGADPFAQRVDKNGQIVNPKYATIENSVKSVKEKKRQKFFSFDFKTDLLQNSSKISIPINSNNNNKPVMKKLLALLSATFGLQLDEKNPDVNAVKAEIAKLQESAKANKSNVRLIKAQTTQLEELNQKVEKLTKFKKDTVAELRKKTIANYKLSAGDTVDATVLATLKKANSETLHSLNATYTKLLEDKYPLSCKECGSHEVSRASLNASGEEKKEKLVAPEKLHQNFIKQAAHNSMKSMHETAEAEKA